MSAPMTLHGIALSGPTYKVGLMLDLCGQPFAYRHVDLRAGAHKTPAFLALNRFGQVPALEHGSLALCQSGAILIYLSETLGKFGGSDAVTRQRAREMLFWEADRLAPGVYRTRAIKRGFFKAEPAVADAYLAVAEQGLQVLADVLAGHDFVAGAEPTIGDIGCWGVVAFCEEAGLDVKRWPAIAAWATRMAGLPGFKLPYDLLPLADRG